MKIFMVLGIAATVLTSSMANKAECAISPADGDTNGVVNSLIITVPNVVGILGGRGRAAIENAGLKWVYAPQGIPVPDPNKNAIIATRSPAGGTSAARGSTITLTLYIFRQASADGDTKGTVNIRTLRSG